MARSWWRLRTKIGPFTATLYHALRGTSLIGKYCKCCTENLRSAYCHIKLLRKILGVKKNLSNFMIKKLLLKDKFKRLDEESEEFFDLLSKIILEPEIQSVFRNKIGLSSEGFDILEAVEEEEKELTTHNTTVPPKKIKMPSRTHAWSDGTSSGSTQSGEFHAIEEKVGFTEEQKRDIGFAHAKACKRHHHHLGYAGCNFATGVEMNIRIAK